MHIIRQNDYILLRKQNTLKFILFHKVIIPQIMYQLFAIVVEHSKIIVVGCKLVLS